MLMQLRFVAARRDVSAAARKKGGGTAQPQKSKKVRPL
jgi:hypothetical protein